MSDALFSAVEVGTPARAGYRLARLEVYNWGTFHGRVWRLTPGADTALLTGDIGSGKSTLVDALTTLLLPAHRIAYNKAAGADARERTLRSYVEGHYKSERSETSGRSRAKGLREGRGHYSVLLGVFVNDGHDETVTLAQVFQQRDSSGQPYRFFTIAPRDLTIADDFSGFGTQLADLRKRLRASGVELFDDYPKYATAMRRRLGIRSEQALELFHQTVSMKSVGNLNDFVREHMLEPSDASGRIRDIIGHFEDLTKAHDAVKRAREQLEALEPLVATAGRYDQALAERTVLEGERAAVEVFVAELRSGLLASEIEALGREQERLGAAREEARAGQRVLTDERESLIEERARAGGDRVGELERLTREARSQAEVRRHNRSVFDDALVRAELLPVAGADAFGALTGLVAEAREGLAIERKALDQTTVAAIGDELELRRRGERLAEELASLRSRTSNLPVEQVDVRAQLCADLGLSPADLPYAGELLDVADEHAQWRGAAERVLRGFALSLLVPQRHYDAVVAWANGRRLTFRGAGGKPVGARLTYERVPERRVPLQPERQAAPRLADVIEVRDGAFAGYLVDELARRADHRLALTLPEFRAERRAVTREGQVRSGERHDKDDRHAVDDPRRWVLGWANERKIAALETELAEVAGATAEASAGVARLTARRDELQNRRDALVRLEAFGSWADLDPGEADARAVAHEQERARLLAGSSRLEEIGRALEANARAAKETERRLEELTGGLAKAADAIARAERERASADRLVTKGTADELAAARGAYDGLRRRLGKTLPTASSGCDDAERALNTDLDQRIRRLGSELGGLGQSLIAYMSAVLNRWQELKADMDATVESRADFVAFHGRVRDDDLPRFEGEFKDQLNKNTIQELAGFNNWLRRQSEAIDDRIARINEALGAVPYNPGRYIRLEREATTNQDVSQFRADLRSLTSDSLAVDGDQYSERRFLEVKRIIERFRGREGYADSDRNWTRRVTDVRNWFVFSASERDAVTDEEWEHYNDSDGKSGGQKEKLAYTILAASLAYQFGLSWGVAKSKDFRFAVIDEAFGRGSDASTRYALDLFAKLGLQLLIVTPLQKVHVIEPYVHAIGFVDNPTGTSSRMETMTIEEYRTRRDRHRP